MIDTLRAPVCVWLTGLPASGKTTLARALVASLRARGRPVLWLDGDDLRPHLAGAGRYDDEGRDAFYGALAHLARLGHEGGSDVVVSATAHKRVWRERARAAIAPGRFIEVWVATAQAVCALRDPKGLYRASREGEVRALPGVGSPYEAPLAAEVVVDLGALAIDEAVAVVGQELGEG